MRCLTSGCGSQSCLASRKEKPLAGLCREFGISRQTGYTWLARYGEGGAGSVLVEKSRRPQRSPSQLSGEVTEAVVTLRQRSGRCPSSSLFRFRAPQSGQTQC